jgi:chromosomal replication initiation ATPase DnaA
MSDLDALSERVEALERCLGVVELPRQSALDCQEVAKLIGFVSVECDVAPLDIVSQRRGGDAVRARQLVCWLARTLTQRSLPRIGRALGGRDHTTVMHAVNRIEDRRAADPEFRRLTDKLQYRAKFRLRKRSALLDD